MLFAGLFACKFTRIVKNWSKICQSQENTHNQKSGVILEVNTKSLLFTFDRKVIIFLDSLEYNVIEWTKNHYFLMLHEYAEYAEYALKFILKFFSQMMCWIEPYLKKDWTI